MAGRSWLFQFICTTHLLYEGRRRDFSHLNMRIVHYIDKASIAVLSFSEM